MKLGFFTLTVLLLPMLAVAETHAVWLQPYAITSQQLPQTLKSIDGLGVNTVYLRMYTIPEGNGVGVQRDFETALAALKALDPDIEVHAWISNGQRNNTDQWNVSDVVWSNLADERERVAQQVWVQAILTQYPQLAGIHLDYIRYPDSDWRSDNVLSQNVTNTVCGINQAVKEVGEYSLSAAVFAAGSNPAMPIFSNVKQSPVEWLRRDCIDWVVPMQYRANSLSTMRDEIASWQQLIPKQLQQVHFGLGYYSPSDGAGGGEYPENIATIIPEVIDTGFGGWSLFALGATSKSSEEKLIRLIVGRKASLQPQTRPKARPATQACQVEAWQGVTAVEHTTINVAVFPLPCDGTLRIYASGEGKWHPADIRTATDGSFED